MPEEVLSACVSGHRRLHRCRRRPTSSLSLFSLSTPDARRPTLDFRTPLRHTRHQRTSQCTHHSQNGRNPRTAPILNHHAARLVIIHEIHSPIPIPNSNSNSNFQPPSLNHRSLNILRRLPLVPHARKADLSFRQISSRSTTMTLAVDPWVLVWACTAIPTRYQT